MKPIAELYTELASKREEAKRLFSSLMDSEGKSRAPSDDELTKMKALNEECELLEKQITDHKDFDQAKATYERTGKLLETPAQPMAGMGNPGYARAKTLFQHAMDNEQFKAFVENAQAGKASKLDKLTIDTPGGIKSLIRLGGNASAGQLVVPDQSGIVDNPWFYRTTIRDIVSVSPTNSNAVEYVRVTNFDNNAAEVGEANSVSGTSGLKPSSTITFKRVQVPVTGIAHLLHTTEWALQDAGELESLIGGMGVNGVLKRLDFQMIRGDGLNDNLEGVLATNGVQVIPFSGDILATALRAQTMVQLDYGDVDDPGGGAEPTAYVMHPLDWEKYLNARDGENRFYWGGPSVIGPRSLWGLPVVTTTAVPEGSPIVADWRLARLWDRQQATVRVFDQHSDYAARNMVLIRIEGRFAFGLVRPEAFATFAMASSP